MPARTTGLTMASFSRETVERMKEGLPEEANLYNPVDVIGDADAKRYEVALSAVLDDPGVNCVLAMVAPSDLLDVTEVAMLLSTYAGKTGKPMVAAWVGGADMAAGAAILKEAGIPNYESPDGPSGRWPQWSTIRRGAASMTCRGPR